MKKKILALLCLWFVIHEASIVTDGLIDERDNKRFAVIFGTTVHEDGALSERLKARLDRSLKLYKDSLITDFFVSGGLGKEGHYEGTKMSEYLVKNGIKSRHIYVDNKGNNTRLTAQNFVSQFPGERSVVVVSQFFHVSRAKLAFIQVGLKNVTGAHADFFEGRDVYSTIREFFGYYKYLVFY